jgi:hypothetical protein
MKAQDDKVREENKRIKAELMKKIAEIEEKEKAL